MMSKEIRQAIYQFWKDNSQYSTFRSNDLHLVRVSKENILQQVIDLHDSDVKEKTDNKNELEAHRKFTSISYRDLHNVYNKTFNNNVGKGTFIRLKPFYIGQVTKREMESCVCITCLNNHCIYNAIRKCLRNFEELPKSLSEYLCKKMKCVKNEKIGYHNLDCILGMYEEKCELTNIENGLQGHLTQCTKNMLYYVF